jgi:type II secretory pathway component GspD/PulD (secretin)
MKKLLVITILLSLSVVALAQNMTVRVKAKGDDLRVVLASIFEQTGQQYVVQTSARQGLYLSLDGVTLEYALEVIAEVADLEFEKKAGVWYVKAKKPVIHTQAQPFSPTAPITSPTATVSKIDPLILDKKVSTKLTKTSIKDVFAAFGKQTGTTIVIDRAVPMYKIDAFMYNTSLKFALERICKAAGLKYELAPGKTVRIRKA